MSNPSIPMFLNNSSSDRCDKILWLIKQSELNFFAQETPFGLNIQLKKKFVMKWESNQNSSNPTESNIADIFSDNDDVKADQGGNNQLRETLKTLMAENAKAKDINADLKTNLAEKAS